ncbi:hypothetical protein [Streptodolium elevatio]
MTNAVPAAAPSALAKPSAPAPAVSSDGTPTTRRRPMRGTERPVPRWAEGVAHLIPLVLLPQCLWRLPFAFGFEMGSAEEGGMPALWISIPYVFALSIITEALALLSFGLVRDWGETAPRWLPFVGGKRIRPGAAIAAATLGALGVMAFWSPFVFAWFGIGENADYTNAGWQVLAYACITPGLLWGPMLLALTCAYWVRHRPAISA